MIFHGQDCILSEIFNTPEIDGNPASGPPNAHTPAILTTSALFQTNSTKRYVPVTTLTIHNNNKFLGNLNQGFKRTIFGKKDQGFCKRFC